MKAVKKEKDTVDINAMSADELKNVIQNQNEYIQKLQDAINRMNVGNLIQRLEIDIEVMKISEKFNSEFIDKIRNEIVELMTPAPKNEVQ